MPTLQQEMTLARWLFNPFVRIAGRASLAAGLAGIVAAGVAAAAAGVRFDGLLDMSPLGNAPSYLPIVEGLINWMSIVAVSVLIARFFGGGGNVRLLDVAGTLALARAPLVLAASIGAVPWIRDAYDEALTAGTGLQLLSITSGVLVVFLAMLACFAWAIVLMWKAFSITLDMKGGRGAVLYFAALVAGEMISKLLVYRIS